ncbi:MAG: NADH-quinone oxidoreductase subunit NuoF, partial [Candidatus Woesearchaeota archaeon]
IGPRMGQVPLLHCKARTPVALKDAGCKRQRKNTFKTQTRQNTESLSSITMESTPPMQNPAPLQIYACGGSSCKSLEGQLILKKLRELVASKGLGITVKMTGCHGFCEKGPLVMIMPDEILYTHVHVSDCEEIIASIENNTIVERLLFRQKQSSNLGPAGNASKHSNAQGSQTLSTSSSTSTDATSNSEIFVPVASAKDIDFYKYQTRILLKRCGRCDPYSIKEYIELQGYAGLRNALQMSPEDVINIVNESGLRGRGGAGFPTGLKWSFLAKAKGEKIIVANADEGDPGSFMDRTLMEGDPFSLLEGMTIAAYAVGAAKGYIYVRAEYPESVKTLQHAIQEATLHGFLGDNIAGKQGFSFTLELRLGAGAFVCGEETALMNSIEGKRGMPRPKPPFPAQAGLWQKPTNINNVKSYAAVSHILREGAHWFRQYGTEKSPGTAVLSLTGKVNYTGIVEVPMGTPLKEIIYKIGGGVKEGRTLKAVLTGGPSGGAIPATMLDLGIDYESLTNAGSIMGSGGVLVLDDQDSMVEVADFFIQFCMDESCGKCTPCREGNVRIHELLQKIRNRQATAADLQELQELADYIKDASLCGLGQTAPNPTLTTLRYFRNEYEALLIEQTPTQSPGPTAAKTPGTTSAQMPGSITGQTLASTNKKRTTESSSAKTGSAKTAETSPKITAAMQTRSNTAGNADTMPSFKYYFITQQCIGCHRCAANCPMHAITGEKKQRHTIHDDLCVGCGLCYQQCPVQAIIYNQEQLEHDQKPLP